MTVSRNALVIGLAGFALASPAAAQEMNQTRNTQNAIRAQSGDQVKDEKEKEEQATAPTSTTGRKPQVSKKAQKAIVELQNAVNANDVANIAAKLASARAVAETADDRFFIATSQTRAAINANDLPGIQAGIEALQASGSAENSEIAMRYADLGNRYLKAQQVAPAAAAFQKSLAIDPNNVDALVLSAKAEEAQGHKAAAAELMQKSFVASKVAGKKVAEGNYKFAAKLAYDTRSPAATAITQAWVSDYPSPTSWRDALRIYRDINKPQGDAKIDIMRLARAAGALAGESDYHSFASELVAKGNLAEAKAVVEDARTAPNVDVTKQAFKDLSVKLAKAPARADVDASAKAAATAKAAIAAGDAYYGLGAYTEAAAQYRAALGKSGVDSNLANLRLGIALARAGDKAGATAALKAAGGTQADIAKYWLNWVASRT